MYLEGEDIELSQKFRSLYLEEEDIQARQGSHKGVRVCIEPSTDVEIRYSIPDTCVCGQVFGVGNTDHESHQLTASCWRQKREEKQDVAGYWNRPKPALLVKSV